MLSVIPAILATTEKEYKDKLDKIRACPKLFGGWVQIDLMDSKFVQNKSVTPEALIKYPTDLKIEAQLMVKYPDNWIDDLIKAKVKRIVFPVEDESGVKERVSHIKDHQIEVGLSLNPETDIEKLSPFVSNINLVLIMSVNPGFGGQDFIPGSLEKITKIRQKSWPVKIEVDGGVNEKVVKDLIDAGADNLVIGSHLLEGDISKNLEKIWKAING